MNKINKSILFLILFGFLAGINIAQTNKPLLLQQPTVNGTQIVFVFAGDLWIVGCEGGEAKQLTNGVGVETNPFFSPDGSLIAFTGQYDGNTDVYLIPSSGGIPRRLTHHPAPDNVVGWMPDGKHILFRSARDSFSRIPRLFIVGINGGFPEELPLPSAFEGSFSPDGHRLAYVPIKQGQRAWKRYRGGTASPIWIMRIDDLKIEKIPRDTSNDYFPMWVGDKIYFLSDRNGPVTLFAYDLTTKIVNQVIKNDGLDFKSASAGPGVIVYEQFGSLNIYDLATNRTRKIDIRINGDLPEVRPHYVKVGKRISSSQLSPTGARAVFEARGEILTVPFEKGDIRNITNTTGSMERDPAWSPDGKWIAYFSDGSGEYQLCISDRMGKGKVKKINLGDHPSFYRNPIWSPDGKKIAYSDKRLNLWYVNIENGASVKVDTTFYFNPGFSFDPDWSPDSRWLTYSKQLRNNMNKVYVYSLESGKAFQITDGLSDAKYASFDKSGKYLFFAASTDVGLTPGWLNLSSLN